MFAKGGHTGLYLCAFLVRLSLSHYAEDRVTAVVRGVMSGYLHHIACMYAIYCLGHIGQSLVGLTGQRSLDLGMFGLDINAGRFTSSKAELMAPYLGSVDALDNIRVKCDDWQT